MTDPAAVFSQKFTHYILSIATAASTRMLHCRRKNTTHEQDFSDRPDFTKSRIKRESNISTAMINLIPFNSRMHKVFNFEAERSMEIML